jgi:transcriptional regulator with XRE-family HTH domain
MGEFGTKLRVVMERNAMTFERLAERTGISRGTLNNITSDVVRSPSRGNVERIMEAFPLEEDRTLLTLAHLRDELPESGRKLVEIRAREGMASKEEPAAYVTERLDATLERALARLRAGVPTNEYLRLVLIDLADCCGL